MSEIYRESTQGSHAQGRLAALPEWSESIARKLALEEGIELGEEHWEVIKLLREHYRVHGNDRHGPQLLRALEEPFGARGGLNVYFNYFLAGPLAKVVRLRVCLYL